jgi:hypothetical protein
MKQSIGFYQFRDAFQSIRPNNFTCEGLITLFDYLEDWENNEGKEIELDVIALCCDYVEMTQAEILENYTFDIDETKDQYSKIMDFLNDKTLVLGDTSIGSIVFLQF